MELYINEDNYPEPSINKYTISKIELERMLEYCNNNQLDKIVLECNETGIGTAFLVSKEFNTEQTNITYYDNW